MTVIEPRHRAEQTDVGPLNAFVKIDDTLEHWREDEGEALILRVKKAITAQGIFLSDTMRMRDLLRIVGEESHALYKESMDVERLPMTSY